MTRLAALLALLLVGAAPGDTTRPDLHYSPARNWINDPNGLVYFEGEWHLFYQYNPYGDRWGHMSWGHAVSRDLHHWTELPVAIPEAEVMAFSGSAVVDWTNSSGLGQGGRPPLVALYTGWNAATQIQAQYLAYSIDRGRTWRRYGTGPVLDIGSTEFRDPKVFWDAARRRWAMVLVLATDNKVALYTSPDLKRWTKRSEFGPAGLRAQAWECPDLFPLPIAGEPGRTRWVLNVGFNTGGPAGGSGSQYFVGDFDGDRFVPDADWPKTPVFVDHGADFYANVTWSDAPAGRRVWIGWASDWRYARHVPTFPARGIMTLPRELGLVRTAAGLRLTQAPTREFAAALPVSRALGQVALVEAPTALRVADGPVDMTVAIDPGSADQVALQITDTAGHVTLVGVNPPVSELFVDRTRSSAHFHDAFPDRHTATLSPGPIRLRVVVDRSIVEVFADDGRTVITDRVFPAPGRLAWSAYGLGGTARISGMTVRSVR